MPSNLTPAATNSTVATPLSGERASAGALCEAAIQPLLNRIEYEASTRGTEQTTLRESISGLSSYTLKVVPIEWGVGASGVWLKTQYGAEGSAFAEQSANSSTEKYAINITPLLPRYGRISKVGIELYGAAGHGAMPVRPRVGLYYIARVHAYNAAWTAAADAEDADQSANVTAYQTPHTIVKTLGTPHTFDIINYKYQLRITGEEGANYVAGLRILGASFEIVPV